MPSCRYGEFYNRELNLAEKPRRSQHKSVAPARLMVAGAGASQPTTPERNVRRRAGTYRYRAIATGLTADHHHPLFSSQRPPYWSANSTSRCTPVVLADAYGIKVRTQTRLCETRVADSFNIQTTSEFVGTREWYVVPFWPPSSWAHTRVGCTAICGTHRRS